MKRPSCASCAASALMRLAAVSLPLVFAPLPGLAPAWSPAQAAGSARDARHTIDKLIEECGVTISIPDDFEEIQPPPTEVYSFEKAWRKKDGSVEIRMAFRPLKRMVIDYTDPHSSAPSPEDMHEMVFTALLGQIARQGDMPMRVLDPQAARKDFNAEWAAIAAFGTDRELNTAHGEGILLGIHKYKLADVFVLILYDGPDKARGMLRQLVKLVKFRSATPMKVLKEAREADRKARMGYVEEGMKASGGAPQCEPPAGAREVVKQGGQLDQGPDN